MRRLVVLLFLLVLIGSCFVFANSKKGTKFMPNKKYEITFLVRSPNLLPGELQMNVDKAWKITRVATTDGTKDLIYLTGKFSFPYSTVQNMPIPEGAGEVVVEDVRIENIDGKKFQ